MASPGLVSGEIGPLPARKITEETCQKFGYSKSSFNGKSVHVAPYFNAEGQLIGQKLRFADKSFKVIGSVEGALPFGAQCWQKTGKMIVVTEGEIDCLSMSQVQGNKWPVVSLINGAQSAKKLAAKHRDYFLGFEKVVVMFDMDEPGRNAAEEFAAIIGSRAHIAELPEKDANEMLTAGRTAELIDAMWKAKQYRPEGIVDMATLKDAVREAPTYGLSWPWETLTKYTYGIPERAIITIGGAGGGGKTDILTQVMMHLATVHSEKLGVFSLEQHVVETARRIAGKFAGKTFHVPDSGWTEEDLDSAWGSLTKGGNVYLYDSFGVNEWDTIRDKIEYLRHTADVRYFFVDNLTALAAAEDSEKEGIERIMADMGSLVQRLDVTIFLVCHLSTPEGTPHEEGGRVQGKHFKGSRSIIFWSYLQLGLERDQQAEDPVERQTTYVRILKERKTGKHTGDGLHLIYTHTDGLLKETQHGLSTSGGSFGFTSSNAEASPDF